MMGRTKLVRIMLRCSASGRVCCRFVTVLHQTDMPQFAAQCDVVRQVPGVPASRIVGTSMLSMG